MDERLASLPRWASASAYDPVPPRIAASRTMRCSFGAVEVRSGGDGFDWFFVAMAHWELGDKAQAREWHEKAVRWMEQTKSSDAELRRFRDEAASLIRG